MKLLLHVCCGPCAAYPLSKLKEENFEIQGIFYNPNIHPYMEYKSRLESAKLLFDKESIPFEELDGYGLDVFLENAYKKGNRCLECYTLRLDRIAREAKDRGFDAFSTTLLVSPYQKHELIKEIGEKTAEKYGVEFLYWDFREGFRKGQQMARDMGLYMQKYCGCVFSEKERYLSKKA